MSDRLNSLVEMLKARGIKPKAICRSEDSDVDHFIEITDSISVSVSAVEEEYYCILIEKQHAYEYAEFNSRSRLVDRLEQIIPNHEAKEVLEWLEE